MKPSEYDITFINKKINFQDKKGKYLSLNDFLAVYIINMIPGCYPKDIDYRSSLFFYELEFEKYNYKIRGKIEINDIYDLESFMKFMNIYNTFIKNIIEDINTSMENSYRIDINSCNIKTVEHINKKDTINFKLEDLIGEVDTLKDKEKRSIEIFQNIIEVNKTLVEDINILKKELSEIKKLKKEKKHTMIELD